MAKIFPMNHFKTEEEFGEIIKDLGAPHLIPVESNAPAVGRMLPGVLGLLEEDSQNIP